MKLNLISCLLPAVLLLSGCSETVSRTEKLMETLTPAALEQLAETDSPSETSLLAETIPERETGVHPLTGESGYPASAIGNRPVAVMINNLEASYPQYGIGAADILYEVPVEGGITRMMGIYADYANVPDVCSVRSCRYYFPKIAMGMDAVYCHWGADQKYAVAEMYDLGIDHLDGNQLENHILYYRDAERSASYSSEHTGYLRGTELPAAFAQFGIRTETSMQGTAFQFSDTVNVPAESLCASVNIAYSNRNITGFVYDASSGYYRMQHSGEPQIDGKTGEQLSFRNVLVLRTEVGALDEEDYLRCVALYGGSGYYISAGGMESILWEKSSDMEPIRFYEISGEELQLNTGKSYIGIVGMQCEVEIFVE